MTGPSPRSERRSWRRRLFWTVLALLVAALVTLRWVIVPYRIAGDSMAPCLLGGGDERRGEIVLVSFLSFWWRTPERWDVVVADFEDESSRGESVKRVVGLPGETVEVRGGRVLADGRPLERPPALRETHVTSKGTFGHGPVTLGSDEYFLLGDNSYASLDSRQRGPLPASQIHGRVVFVVVPWASRRWVE